MSIYLYVKCRDCNKLTGVVGRNTRAPQAWYLYRDEKSIQEITDFLVQHMGHNVSVIDEYAVNPQSPPWNVDEG